MERKSAVVFFIFLFVGISLFSNGLKQDFGDMFKNITIDQKELGALSKKLNDKDLKDSHFIDDGFQGVKSRLGIYINILHIYNLINPECRASKKLGKDYIKKVFHDEAEGNKHLVNFLIGYQSKITKPELIAYYKKYLKYNEQISILIKEFKQ